MNNSFKNRYDDNISKNASYIKILIVSITFVILYFFGECRHVELA